MLYVILSMSFGSIAVRHRTDLAHSGEFRAKQCREANVWFVEPGGFGIIVIIPLGKVQAPFSLFNLSCQ